MILIFLTLIFICLSIGEDIDTESHVRNRHGDSLNTTEQSFSSTFSQEQDATGGPPLDVSDTTAKDNLNEHYTAKDIKYNVLRFSLFIIVVLCLLYLLLSLLYVKVELYYLFYFIIFILLITIIK